MNDSIKKIEKLWYERGSQRPTHQNEPCAISWEAAKILFCGVSNKLIYSSSEALY